MADLTAPISTEWLSENAISAGEAKGFLTINGQNHVLFYAKSNEAKITKNKQEVRVVGQRGVGNKATSWTGAGTLAIYEVTSMFKEMFVQFVQTGTDFYFSIQITNESPKYGREVKVLTGCNFDEIDFAHMADDDSFLEQELPYTFEGVELLEKFKTV